MKKQIISLIILALLPLVASAQAVEIDGIYYNVVTKLKTAEVTSNPNGYTDAVVIPATVTYKGVTCNVNSIGNRAFWECYNLTSVSIPNSVTTIGMTAFHNCFSLTNIAIPNSVTCIEDGAFEFCSGLTSINIPNSVTSIGGWTFAGCSLTSITIPSSVTSIGGAAFNCHGLTEVNISDLTAWCNISFSGSAFINDSHLYLNGEEIKNLVIPNSVTNIGAWAFHSCCGLTSVTIPNSVNSIGCNAFSDCSGLTSVTIPNSVTSIGDYAFSGCNGLTSVTIPNSVTSIGGNTFSGCSGLTSVTIPNSVTSIGEYAFQNCSSLTSVTIGGSSLRIGSHAFSSCPELTDVYCHIINPLETYSDHVWETNYNCIEPTIFDNSYVEYATLHVPATAYGIYKTTEPWSNFKEIVTIEGTTPEIEKCKTPTIAYKDGKLTFSCETEGVDYEYDVKLNGSTSGQGNEVQLSPSITISVYATKAGKYNSDVATKTIDPLSLSGDVSGDGKVDATDLTKLIDILLGR